MGCHQRSGALCWQLSAQLERPAVAIATAVTVAPGSVLPGASRDHEPQEGDDYEDLAFFCDHFTTPWLQQPNYCNPKEKWVANPTGHCTQGNIVNLSFGEQLQKVLNLLKERSPEQENSYRQGQPPSSLLKCLLQKVR